jgi:hypothetical protein
MDRIAPEFLCPTLRADPPADDTVARMLAGASGPAELSARIAQINGELARWQTNGALASWRPGPDLEPRAAEALIDYLAACQHLPEWTDRAAIARAETLFMDISMLSCTLLFCASLPECYVLPDLSAVLHAAGQLEVHTDYRVRSTAAMIFPVMLAGGLTTPEGGGVAQALKVRLIHATIRYLILRGTPRDALGTPPVPPLTPAGGGIHHTLYAHGWDTSVNGLPCNQEELAYTLLTFSYVFVRGLRTLRLALAPQDEEAYLHTWNVLGHVLGIEQGLMATTMAQAQHDFETIQARARLLVRRPDPRPLLAADLMKAMENEIPIRLLKPVPTLLTRLLCRGDATRDLGLDARVPLLARAVFALAVAGVRCVDAVARVFVPGFSLSRMLTRALGQRLVTHFLLDLTRPLRLPDALLGNVADTAAAWRTDPKASHWMRRLETRLAGRAPSP